MPSPLAELLAVLARIFQERALSWYVFGAQAAIIHGAARLTGDVDVTVALGTLSAETLAATLQTEGFTMRVSNLDEFVERTRVLPLVHTSTGMPVDIVIAGPGLEEVFLHRAEVHLIEGVKVPVACPEDVVAMKILAARPKDIEDAVAILAAGADAIRIDLIRDTLQLLEQALAQNDLLRSLAQALQRSKDLSSTR